MSKYILRDRRSGVGNWAIQIKDGQLNITSTAETAQSEPIFEDYSISGTYWKLFIEDGQLAIETTTTVRNDEVVLKDLTTNIFYKLIVDNGQIGYTDTYSISLVDILEVKDQNYIEQELEINNYMNIELFNEEYIEQSLILI